MSSNVMVRKSLVPSSFPTKDLSPATPSITVLLAMGRAISSFDERRRGRSDDGSRGSRAADRGGKWSRPPDEMERRGLPLGADPHHGGRGGDRRVRGDRRRSLFQLHPHEPDPALPLSRSSSGPARPRLASALLHPP